MYWGSTHSDPPKRSRFTRTVATTRPAASKEPTRWGAITGSNTHARTRRGEPTGQIFNGVRRFR